MGSLAITPQVRGDSTALEEDLYGGVGKPNVELFVDQLIRDTVVVVVQFDVVIDIDPGTLPVGIDIGVNRERFESRFFERFEQDPSGAFELLKGTVIECFQLFGDGLLQFAEAEEGSVPQWSQDPVLHLLHSGFDLGLVLGLGHPGRDNDRAVMLCELPISGVEVRFVTAGTCHGRLQIVGDKDLGDTAEELEGMDMGLDPRGEFLGESGFGEGVIAGSQGGYKDLGLSNLSGLGICDLHGLAGIVDKELFSGPVFLAETKIQLLDPLLVVVAESTVLVAIGVGLFVLVPQKLKGDALSLEFLIKVVHGGHLTLLLSDRGAGWIKPVFQGGFIKVSSKAPIQPRPLRPVQVILNRAPADA